MENSGYVSDVEVSNTERYRTQKTDNDTGTSGDDREIVAGEQAEKSPDTSDRQLGLVYGLTDFPQPHLCFLFGLQQVFLSISSTISIPIVVSKSICADHLDLVTAEIMATFLFMCGVCTLLQDILGVRLPILQGGSHKFLPAIAALMQLDKWTCPPKDQLESMWNGTLQEASGMNITLYNDQEVWQSRMREIQGGIMLASVVQIVIGCTGILGFLLRYIGPLTIIPCITLVGLSLVNVALNFCASHMGIAALTIFLIFLFSLYLSDVKPPLPTWNKKKGCHVTKYPAFKLFSVILTVVITWGLCGILTSYDVLSKEGPERLARTDSKLHALTQAKWFFFPYPGQWGVPTISSAGFAAMLAATIASIIESVGDYYACARVCNVPPPPPHAINRGIFMEGLGSLISGAIGSGGATTSYSQNVGAIGFTKVGSRAAFVCAGLIFLVSGLVGKFGAFLTMIPDPVLGGVIVISFGMVTSVGLSNIQFVQITSSRNLSIIGSSLLLGLMVPAYFKKNPTILNSGNVEFDQAITVLLSTSMFVGGALGFILDNTVPGSLEERGILKWREQAEDKSLISESRNQSSIYDLPLIMPLLRKLACARYIPCLPTFNVKSPKLRCCRRKRTADLSV